MTIIYRFGANKVVNLLNWFKNNPINFIYFICHRTVFNLSLYIIVQDIYFDNWFHREILHELFKSESFRSLPSVKKSKTMSHTHLAIKTLIKKKETITVMVFMTWQNTCTSIGLTIQLSLYYDLWIHDVYDQMQKF